MKNKKGSFIMYESFAAPMEILTIEQRGLLFTAIFEYQLTGEVSVQLPDIVKVAFLFIKDTFDRDNQAYEERCRKNAENGKRGGRPKKEEEAVDNTVVEAVEADTVAKSPAVVEAAEMPAEVEAAELTEEQAERLYVWGVPKSYINPRLGRAFSYARRSGRDVCELLIEWFQQDGKAARGKDMSNVDTMSNEEWLERRLEQTLNSYSACSSAE